MKKMMAAKETKNQKMGKSEFLSENQEGIYFDEQHAKMIWQGNKSLIVKSQLFSNKVGKLLYFVGGNNCYGILKLKSVNQIDLKEFTDSADKHRISEAEREIWWPGKQKLFAYDFALVAIFDNPKLVKTSKNSFIEAINFLTDSEKRYKELISGIKTYNPKKLSTEILKSDLKLIVAMLGCKLSNKKISCSFVEIRTILRENYNELNKRGNFDLQMDSMDLIVKEIYEDITKSGAGSAIKIELMNAFKPMEPAKRFSNEDEVIKFLFGE